MLKRPLEIERTLPNDWDDVDPDAGWVRPVVERRGGGRVPVLVLAGLVAVGLLLAGLAVGFH